MPTKKALLDKLCRKPIVRNFSKQELDSLMGRILKMNCIPIR